jgi:succinyl-diaminopimelate desuccinylase
MITGNLDPIALLQGLIRCPSVTPAEGGALALLETELGKLGFRCHRLRFEEPGFAPVENLYARFGTEGPNFCFAGHTDVVPVGDPAGWTVDPFGGEIAAGNIYGRGAADMKGGVAAFVAAAARVVADLRHGSVSLLITGDEEGDAVNGTVKVLEWLAANGEKLDACLVGEPTNPSRLGDMVKIGRRGSMTGTLKVFGTQGHAAYPHLADNPLPRLAAMCERLANTPLDTGSDHFPATTLALTTIDVGNPASNVIPAEGRAVFNIRFNDLHSSDSIKSWTDEICAGVGGRYELSWRVSGESFLTPPGDFSTLVASAIEAETGIAPELSTTGGTSDARFIRSYCPVVEFGLVGQTMHKVDEHVAVADVVKLTAIYERVLKSYFRLG